MKAFTQLSLAALATFATASVVNVNKRETPLSVELTASGNSEVTIAVTNSGEKAINLLSKGTFIDEVNPVEKVTMYSAGGSKSIFAYTRESTLPIRLLLPRQELFLLSVSLKMALALCPFERNGCITYHTHGKGFCYMTWRIFQK